MVQHLIRSRRRWSGLQYQVNWGGEEDRSWVLAGHVVDPNTRRPLRRGFRQGNCPGRLRRSLRSRRRRRSLSHEGWSPPITGILAPPLLMLGRPGPSLGGGGGSVTGFFSAHQHLLQLIWRRGVGEESSGKTPVADWQL